MNGRNNGIHEASSGYSKRFSIKENTIRDILKTKRRPIRRQREKFKKQISDTQKSEVTHEANEKKT